MSEKLEILEQLARDFEPLLARLKILSERAQTVDKTECHAYSGIATRYYNACYSTSQLLRSQEMLAQATKESREMLLADIRKLKAHGTGIGRGLGASTEADVDELIDHASKVLAEAEKFALACE